MAHQQSPGAGPGKPAREEWMDTVKGVAITLVVFGHSIKILGGEGWEVANLWNQLNIVIGQWRMPVFMLVAGFFVTRSMTKYGTRFWRLRPVNMAWLFLFWTAVYWVVYPLIGAVDRDRTAGATFSEIVWHTVTFHSYLWFLLALAIYYALQGLLGVTPNKWVVALAGLLFLVFVPGLVADVSWGTNELFTNWVFFLVGAWWSQSIRTWVAGVPTWQGILWCLAFMAAILVWMPTRDIPVLKNFGGALPPLLAIPAGLFLLSRLDGKPGLRWARRVGPRSLAVYVLHPLLMQLAVVALTWVVANPTDSAVWPWLHWAGPPVFTVLAVMLCLGIQRATANVPYMWGLPAPKTPPAPSRGRHL